MFKKRCLAGLCLLLILVLLISGCSINIGGQPTEHLEPHGEPHHPGPEPHHPEPEPPPVEPIENHPIPPADLSHDPPDQSWSDGTVDGIIWPEEKKEPWYDGIIDGVLDLFGN
jgi:hypothetical protein